MMKNIILILTLSLLFSANVNSQDTIPKSFVIGLRTGAFFNLGGYSPYTDETILAGNLTTYVRIKRHEIYAGCIFPALIPETQLYSYTSKSTIGALAGYRYNLFNPGHKSNLFFQYEFQYIYFSGRVKEGSKTGYYYYDTVDEYFRFILGMGFSQYFDKKQNVGISLGCGYILTESFNFNFSFNFSVKLASFKKQKSNHN